MVIKKTKCFHYRHIYSKTKTQWRSKNEAHAKQKIFAVVMLEKSTIVNTKYIEYVLKHTYRRYLVKPIRIVNFNTKKA